jgi:hypothetical protein
LYHNQKVSVYWPTDGIQCTLYETWLQQAAAADYNVVWMPMRKDVAASFDVSAAVDFFEQWGGTDYGYQVGGAVCACLAHFFSHSSLD